MSNKPMTDRQTRKHAPADSPEGRAEADQKKREFIKRFGGYAATAPVVMYSLMSPRRSAAAASDTGPIM